MYGSWPNPAICMSISLCLPPLLLIKEIEPPGLASMAPSQVPTGNNHSMAFDLPFLNILIIAQLNMVSPGSPLIGKPGHLIHRSPDGCLSIRRALMSNFPAEAIVNATDRYMTINTANMSGAEFQITHAAGSELRNHLHYNYPLGLRTGDVLSTPSFEMTSCYYIIHVNGLNYNTRRKDSLPLLRQQLADCYRRCMDEAFRLGVKSIAFPCISTGSMGWPRGEAARISVATVRAWLRHPIHRKKRRVIERVDFLADPVGKQADQDMAWIAAFR